MAPPFTDENVSLELVQDGLDAADDELRDAVADEYEEDALDSEEVEESLDDIDHGDEGFAGLGRSPEVDAIHPLRSHADLESTDPEV